jgi:hypothetical protein
MKRARVGGCVYRSIFVENYLADVTGFKCVYLVTP